MNEKDILNFKSLIANMSLNELKEEKLKIDDSITKMLFDSDLMMKLAIVVSAIEEKEEGANA